LSGALRPIGVLSRRRRHLVWLDRSGAEVLAGGSIHIYGTLRGRAVAGVSGNRQARIFCGKIEAELLAIDGF
jgi:septum formation inhibitor MinC